MRLSGLMLSMALVLSACASAPHKTPSIAALPALELGNDNLSAQAALNTTPSADFLSLDEEMRIFVDNALRRVSSSSDRLRVLHYAIRNPGLLNLRYDPVATHTAREAFHQGTANCLGFANLYVALARYAGLPSYYQQVVVKPEWEKQGQWLTVARHINAGVRTTSRYSIDLRPIEKSKQIRTRKITDHMAHAQHYNNIAIDHLLKNNIEGAYRYSIKALSLSSKIDFLWSNLGLVYRHNQQHQAAIQAYQIAINLNPQAHSAMNNLLALYQQEGKREEAKVYAKRMAQYKQQNPYYHAQRGHGELRSGDYRAAVKSFKRAIRIKNNEVDFYFELATALKRQGKLEQSFEQLKSAGAIRQSPAQKRRHAQLLENLRPLLAVQSL